MNIHGGWRIEAFSEQILFTEYWSAWNAEGATAFAKEFKKVISENMPETPWVIIGDATNWGLATGDVKDVLVELNHWVTNRGRVKEIYVTHSILQDHEGQKFVHKHTPTVQVRVRSHEEAISYANSLGIEVTLHDFESWLAKSEQTVQSK